MWQCSEQRITTNVEGLSTSPRSDVQLFRVVEVGTAKFLVEFDVFVCEIRLVKRNLLVIAWQRSKQSASPQTRYFS